MNMWMIAAAFFSLVATAAHIFLGGQEIARPLLASKDLNDVAKFTNYYCWHIATIVLTTMTALYVYAATTGATDMAVLATLLAAIFLVWSLVLIGWKRLDLIRFPQWMLFLPVTVTGIIALL